VWLHIDEGEDAHPDHDYQRFPGSSSLFSWQADSLHLPLVRATFIPCFCRVCVSPGQEKCPHSKYVHANTDNGEPEEYISHLLPPPPPPRGRRNNRRTSRGRGAAEGAEEDSDA
jgi:hypothetical protein